MMREEGFSTTLHLHKSMPTGWGSACPCWSSHRMPGAGTYRGSYTNIARSFSSLSVALVYHRFLVSTTSLIFRLQERTTTMPSTAKLMVHLLLLVIAYCKSTISTIFLMFHRTQTIIHLCPAYEESSIKLGSSTNAVTDPPTLLLECSRNHSICRGYVFR